MDWTDAPSHRKVHTQPIPRLGGLVFLPTAACSFMLANVCTSIYRQQDPEIHLSTLVMCVSALIIYLVGQGIRILFEAITSRNRPASNYVSTFFSHVMAVGADIIMLANLAEVDRLLLFPLYALVFNAVVISVSNIITFSKVQGWAGSNYFDSLSSNAIALLCLLQFLKVPLKRLFRNVVVVGACLFLVISAGCCVAFNIRFTQKEAE
ncbi:MAG: hypothetical protein HUJ99_04935 [Bacteroidaceae bacterium]|nr:hypothetical protein [Bacteroidaceae bacterium]